MKVLALVHAPIYTGPQNTMTRVANILAPQGTHVTVVQPDDADEAVARLRTDGVDVISMPLHRMRALKDPRVHLTWLRALNRESKMLADIIRRDGYDVVLTHSLPNLHGWLAARRAKVPLVWAIIDTYPPMVARRAYMPIVRRYADSVLTTGHEVGVQHPGVDTFGERWVEFFPCVDMDQFRADPAVRESAREELGLPEDAIVIGNVAGLTPMKGHHTFIQAAARLRETQPDARFVILGARYPYNDDYYAGLWSAAEAAGLELGKTLIVVDPKARVPELAQAFDVFWMTSEPQSEGLPTVIGEAKALGLPVVATDVGSTREAVREGVSGYVVPPRDPDAIAAATRRIIASPERAAEMGRAARQEAEMQYAAEKGAAAHQRAFDIAVEHYQNRR